MTRPASEAKSLGGPKGPVAAEQRERAARCLKALAHPIRLCILESLREGEKTVTELELAAGTTQSNISQHLRLLCDRELVKARKQGNQVFYQIADRRIFKLLDSAKAVFCRE